MSRPLSAAELGAVTPWGPPSMDAGAPQPARAGALTAGRLEDLQQEAYREAFEQGRRDGFAAGREEVRGQLDHQIQRLQQLLDDIARPLAELDAEVQHELLALAFALARQIVRRELRQDPTQIIGIVREAIGLLPVAAREVRVQLHPEDAAIVREHLAEPGQDRAWTLVEDPMMMRGGCRILTTSSRIDARLEARLGALLCELMGDERSAETRSPERP